MSCPRQAAPRCPRNRRRIVREGVPRDHLLADQRAERPPHARGLEAVREARPHVVDLREREDLRLVLHPAEGRGKDDAVEVALEVGARRERDGAWSVPRRLRDSRRGHCIVIGGPAARNGAQPTRRPGGAQSAVAGGAPCAGYAWCGSERGRHEDRRHAGRRRVPLRAGPHRRRPQLDRRLQPFTTHVVSTVSSATLPLPIVSLSSSSASALPGRASAWRRRRQDVPVGLRFRNFQFTFADACGATSLHGRGQADGGTHRPARVSNRVLVKKSGGPCCSARSGTRPSRSWSRVETCR